MQVALPRSEIVRLVHAHLGEQTSFALGSQTSEQTLAAVGAAALKALQDCRWVTTLNQVTVDLGAEQNVLNYPAGVNAGSVSGLAVYDTDAQVYYPMEKRVIPVWASQDQQQIAGGDTFESVKARPRYWQELTQIKLWPYSDKAYKIRVEYMANASLPLDSSMSLTDGQLIVYMAASMLATQRENFDMAKYMAGMYMDRLMGLRAWQSAGNRFALDPNADLGEDEVNLFDNAPHWYRGLSPVNP